MNPLLLLITIGFVVAQQPSSAEWIRADVATQRLDPSVFRSLPEALRIELRKRGCTIPQLYSGGEPHNVVQGAFRRAGEIDTAALCSRGRSSAIVVFWSGNPDDVAEIATQADSEFLQVVSPTRIGFSRAIAVARPEYIREQQRRHGGALLPAVTHDGIEDLFVEKASSVWYWQNGEWFRLTGAD